MSYSVRLDEAAQAKIVEWRLPQEGMRAILHCMDDLSETPSRYLMRVASSAHVLETDVVYHHPGPPPLHCLVVSSVRYGVDEETLHIVDCDRLFDDSRDRPAEGADPLPPDQS
jgi:hypothetical protein